MARLIFLPLAGAALAAAGAGEGRAARDDGLALYRTPDARGRACSTCHSPDGIELATYDFDRATIVRRATPHLGSERAQRVADYLLAMRARLRQKPLDPMRDRPLQPGGHVLPGRTDKERDRALAPTLRRLIPTLCGAPITSSEAARRALAEVQRIDLPNLPVGFEFDRISEDEFHGPEHAVIADWFADVPPITLRDLRPSEDRYLADPSDNNLTDLLAALDAYFRGSPFSVQLAIAKRESLLVLTHEIRTGRTYAITPDRINPFGRVAESWSMWLTFPIGSDVDGRKTTYEPMAVQGQGIILRWAWMAFVRSPGVTGGRRFLAGQTERAMVKAYPCHFALYIATRTVASYFDPKQPPPPHSQGFDGDSAWGMASRVRGGSPLDRRVIANTLRMGWLLQHPDGDQARLEQAVVSRLGPEEASAK